VNERVLALGPRGVGDVHPGARRGGDTEVVVERAVGARVHPVDGGDGWWRAVDRGAEPDELAPRVLDVEPGGAHDARAGHARGLEGLERPLEPGRCGDLPIA
jgi:hypothetical protein